MLPAVVLMKLSHSSWVMDGGAIGSMVTRTSCSASASPTGTVSFKTPSAHNSRMNNYGFHACPPRKGRLGLPALALLCDSLPHCTLFGFAMTNLQSGPWAPPAPGTSAFKSPFDNGRLRV